MLFLENRPLPRNHMIFWVEKKSKERNRYAGVKIAGGEVEGILCSNLFWDRKQWKAYP